MFKILVIGLIVLGIMAIIDKLDYEFLCKNIINHKQYGYIGKQIKYINKYTIMFILINLVIVMILIWRA